ncbi:MAG TPA: hypothetical protein VNE63_23660 [Candidatus Acidoferrales bacterium]|nr:hypothetical protein [Candidatus Acidoferrales bacterium]
MGEVTHEQVKLMLQLYDTRRESRLREAREWYLAHFRPANIEDIGRLCPPGSKDNASMRMVLSYWDMVANIVNRGLIDEEFFFENSGEQWFVWERIKPVIGAMRARSKNPHQFAQLEKHAKHMEAWREKRAPGSVEISRAQMAALKEQSSSKAT